MNSAPLPRSPRLTRRQQTILVLFAVLLAVSLFVVALVALGGGQIGTVLSRLLLGVLFLALCGLGGLVYLYARSMHRREETINAQVSQVLASQVREQSTEQTLLRTQNEYLASLNDTAVALAARLNLTELLQDILRRAAELTGTQNGYVFLLDPQTNEMVMRVGIGVYQEFIGTKAQEGVALAGKVWQTGEAVAVDDYRNWSGRLADHSRNVLRAVVGVPLKHTVTQDNKATEQVTGVIGLAHTESDKRFGPTEMDVLGRFAALAAVALDNARLYESSQRELEQRRVVEKNLAYERDLLQALMDSIPDLIFFKDRESRFVRSNAAHLKNLGAEKMDEVFGKTDLDYHADAPAHDFMADEKSILETGVPILNKVEANPAADGTIRYFSTSKVPWRDQDGNIVGTLGVAHEVTDRILAETFLESVVENLPTMLFVKEAKELRFVRWNKAAEQIAKRTAGEMLGKNDYDFFPPDEVEFFIAKDRETLSRGEVIDIPEEPLQDAQGSIRWLHTKKFPVLGADGKPAFLVGISEDITDRKNAEDALRASEELYRDLFENATDLIQSVKPDGHFEYVNRKWRETLGYTDDDLPGLTFLDIVHPDERTHCLELFGRVMNNEVVEEIETAFVTRDGHKILVEGTTSAKVENGQVVSTRGIFLDVTERRAAQERATFQTAMLTAQFELSPDGILVVGGDDRILSYNRRFVEMWKIPPGAMDSGAAEPLRQAVQENLLDVEGWLKRTGEIYMSQTRSTRDEIEFKDGQLFERYSTPITSPDGTYLGRVWFFHDITESRRAEQDIRRVVQGTRAIFWRAQVTALEDRTQQALGYAWETTVSNPDAAMQYMPFDLAPGQPYEDALYAATLEEDRVKMDQVSSRALDSGVTGYAQEYRVRDGNGELHWMYEDARIRRFGEGKFEVVGVTTDLTARKTAEEQVQKQNAYLNALQETSLGLMQRLDVNSLLQDIVARAGALVGTENGYVFLRDPGATEMELRVGVGAYQGFVGRRTQPGVGLAGQVWQTNAPVVVDDYRTYGSRLSDPSRDILRAVAGVPLRSGDQVVGVIGLAYLDEDRKFGPAEIQVLERFAQLATISLDNARLYETAQQELGERTRAELALNEQLRETELLNRVTGHAVSLDIDSALVEICRDLAAYFKIPRAGVALLNPEHTALTIVAESEVQGHASAVGNLIPLEGNTATQLVIAQKSPLAIKEAQRDERMASLHALMRDLGVASILIAPLLVRDEVLGTIGLDSYEPKEFSAQEIGLVQRVAISISTALENARLYRAAQQELAERRRAEEQMTRRNQELEVISRVSAVMTTNIDMVSALETLARELVHTFNARNCGIALLNEQRTDLTVVADALNEEHEEHAVGIVIPLEGNLSSQYVVNNKRSLVIADAQTDPMTEPIHERMAQRRTKCLAIIPLLSGGDVIGTIGLDTTDPNHIFSDEEIRLAETMANQMANAIEKQRLFDQTRERARREQLTREIAGNMTRTLDMEQILQTTARQLSQALGASHAVVRMGASEQAQDKERNGGNGDFGDALERIAASHSSK